MANPLKKVKKAVKKGVIKTRKQLQGAGKKVSSPVTKFVKKVTSLSDIEKLTEAIKKGK